jgi:hypothetical protein
MNDRVEIVRFTGGEHDGLVVEAPAHVAERLHAMRFEVLATGRLYDLTDQCRIPGARAITPPAPRPAPEVEAPVPAAVAIPAPAPSPEQPATAVLEPPALMPPPAPRRAVPPLPTMPVFQPGRAAD